MRLSSLLLLFVTTLGACAEQDQVWGIPRDTFAERLERGDYDFLRHLDYRELDLDEVTRLRPGAAYYLAEVYGELELDAMRRRMLTVAMERGREPWRRHATGQLLIQLGAEQRWEELAERAGAALEIYPEAADLLYARHAALYEQGADEEIIAAITAEDGALRPLLAAPASDDRRREVELWRAVSSFRLRRNGWEDEVRRFFVDIPAAPQHSRLYVFLIARSAAQRPFTAAELSLFAAIARVAEGDFRTAAEAFLELAEAADPPLAPAGVPVTEWLVRDMGLAFQRAGYRGNGIPVLERYARLTDDPMVRARALEYAGRLYRAAGNTQAAAERFEEALSLHTDRGERRRLVWYLLDTRISARPQTAVEALLRHRDAATAEGYFDRLLDGLASELVRREAWTALAEAGAALEELGFDTIAERFHYLAAEASLRGYAVGGPHGGDPVRLLERIDSDPYYRLLAAVRLGRSDALVADSGADGADDADRTTDAEAAPAEGPGSEELVLGFLDFALYEHAYELAMERSGELSVEAIERVAERIQTRGLLIESLRLMARARWRDAFVLTPRAARILYPRAFSMAMDEVAAREGLDLPVFYGLVREESHFAADIVSHAGATGLAQLMPSTAADVAQRMRIDDPDLTDPLTNLSIGGYYLSYLLGRFDGQLLPALAAYNGGQGRVRRWVRENGAFAGPLFHEAMPIRETRHYIRKVLVSAAYYGEIYDRRSVADTVQLFFPDVTPIGEEPA